MKKLTDQEKLTMKLKKHSKSFNELWSKIVGDINDYKKDNNDSQGIDLYHEIENITDNLCLSGAWITDRMNGITAVTHSPQYNKSLTKKVRKALGYLI